MLPFQNMSGDPEQEYFADGMVEDITTALSRIRSLFVIARNSAFTYKGRAVDVRQVGRELGVRYVLEGSVRKAGDARAHHRPVGRRGDRGASLGRPVRRHAGGRVRPAGPGDRKRGRGDRAESRRGGDRAGAAQADGEPAGLRPHAARVTALLHQDTGSMAEAARLLRKAIEIDPTYAPGLAYLALCQWTMVSQGWMERDNPAVAEMIDLARAALALDGNDPEVLRMAASIIALPGGDLSGGIALINKVDRP